ncbi:MAG: hypothetical protein NXI15_04240 [Gammaproteobacteria bacterium]|nr:hypothetical protein [Gammaproteobacteria bacterium]
MKYEPATQAVISPGDDPLANLIFQELLNSSDIQYSRDSDGYYVSELENRDTMEELALKAHDQLRNVSQIQLGNPCVIDQLNEKLQGVTYFVGKNERGSYLRAPTSTYERNEIVSKVAAAERDCAKGA